MVLESVKLLLPPTERAPVLPEMTPAKVSALAVLTVKVLPALIAKLPPVFVPFKSVILKLFCALKMPLSVRALTMLPVLETVKVPPFTLVTPPYVLAKVSNKVPLPEVFTFKVLGPAPVPPVIAAVDTVTVSALFVTLIASFVGLAETGKASPPVKLMPALVVASVSALPVFKVPAPLKFIAKLLDEPPKVTAPPTVKALTIEFVVVV